MRQLLKEPALINDGESSSRSAGQVISPRQADPYSDIHYLSVRSTCCRPIATSLFSIPIPFHPIQPSITCRSLLPLPTPSPTPGTSPLPISWSPSSPPTANPSGLAGALGLLPAPRAPRLPLPRRNQRPAPRAPSPTWARSRRPSQPAAGSRPTWPGSVTTA